jgi:hypothetical protein
MAIILIIKICSADHETIMDRYNIVSPIEGTFVFTELHLYGYQHTTIVQHYSNNHTIYLSDNSDK